MMFSAIQTMVISLGLATVALGQIPVAGQCLAMYKVMPGDDCPKIVAMHPNTLSVQELLQWNNLTATDPDCRRLQPGTDLCVRQLRVNEACPRT